jgi:hypothetical protein
VDNGGCTIRFDEDVVDVELDTCAVFRLQADAVEALPLIQ